MSEEDAIRRCLIEYGVAIDTHDWTLLRACFTDDVEADYGANGRWTSADALTADMAVTHEKYATTQHRMTNFLIDIAGDRATASSYVDVMLAYQAMDRFLHGIGRYQDELLRGADGRWRIARRRTTMALVRSVPLEPLTGRPPAR